MQEVNSFAVFLFCIIENFQLVLSENMDSICLCAVICYLGLKGLSPKEVQEDMVATPAEGGSPFLQHGEEVGC